MEKSHKEFLTIQEVVALTGKSRSTIKNHLKKGMLKGKVKRINNILTTLIPVKSIADHYGVVTHMPPKSKKIKVAASPSPATPTPKQVLPQSEEPLPSLSQPASSQSTSEIEIKEYVQFVVRNQLTTQLQEQNEMLLKQLDVKDKRLKETQDHILILAVILVLNFVLTITVMLTGS